MRLKIGLAVAVIACVAMVAYPSVMRNLDHRHALSQANELFRQDAGQLEAVLLLEADSPEATLKEFSDLCERSIINRTDRLAAVRSLQDLGQPIRDSLIADLTAENSLVRAKRRFSQLSGTRVLRFP